MCDAGTTVSVNLRIEGLYGTIYEASITTKGREVTTDTGKTHCCNCAKNGSGPRPPAGPNCTSALADAADQAGFTFDGSWSAGTLNDFMITRIADSQQIGTHAWRCLLDYKPIPVGGCQQKVTGNQNILWAFDGFNKTIFLKLEGPENAIVNQEYTYKVTDGSQTQPTPIQFATVGGKTTNERGEVILRFESVGIRRLKAEAHRAIRSNAIRVTVSRAIELNE